MPLQQYWNSLCNPPHHQMPCNYLYRFPVSIMRHTQALKFSTSAAAAAAAAPGRLLPAAFVVDVPPLLLLAMMIIILLLLA